MGDRCQVEVTVRKDEAERFIKIIGYEPDASLEMVSTMEMTFDESNYGMAVVLHEAALASIEFYGSHTSGDSYGATEFFHNGKGNIEYIPASEEHDGIVVSGNTPLERLERLQELERRIKGRHDFIERMHNPLYDLTRQSDVHTS